MSVICCIIVDKKRNGQLQKLGVYSQHITVDCANVNKTKCGMFDKTFHVLILVK